MPCLSSWTNLLGDEEKHTMSLHDSLQVIPSSAGATATPGKPGPKAR